MSHTPGPWGIAPDWTTVYTVETDSLIRMGYAVALTSPVDHPVGWVSAQERQANARLIAAAPDLYEALIRVRNEAADDTPEMWGQVEAAIAKAEGK